MLGFSTWAVLAFHLSTHHLVPTSVVPVLYAVAMAAASAAAVLFGRLYDRVGLRGLVVLPGAGHRRALPLLRRRRRAGSARSGGLRGGHGRARLHHASRGRRLLPAHRRGAGYGNFTAIYGIAWLAGATVIGALYESSRTALYCYVAATQLVALVLLLPLLARRKDGDA